MDLTKTFICCALVLIVMTDVITARAIEGMEVTELKTILKDIDKRLIHSEKQHSRRRRRHVVTQNLAIMEFCIQNRHRCRQEIERLRRLQNQHNQDYTVVVIEK